MFSMAQGQWLGIDIGSSKKKVCSFCLVSSDGTGRTSVSFERGPAGEGYPEANDSKSLFDQNRPPTYLRKPVETAIGTLLDRSELVGRWLGQCDRVRSAVAIDAPVALAVGGSIRATEAASTQTFATPDRATFENLSSTKGDAYHRVNTFWKCVGFAVYRHLAHRLAGELLEQHDIASWTCARPSTSWRLRETFPSDVYKRANGRQGVLAPEARHVLRHLVAEETPWLPAGRRTCRPVKQTIDRLSAIRDFLRLDLEAAGRLCEMRKRGGITGDLWDAFTCAFAACCEDHQASRFHGWDGLSRASDTLRREGAIMTVCRDSGA